MLEAVCDYPVSLINWHDRAAGPPLSVAKAMLPGVLAAGVGSFAFCTLEDLAKSRLRWLMQRADRGSAPDGDTLLYLSAHRTRGQSVLIAESC